ncbi:hypothetical protein ASPBRDRAFT_33109 [Aspergillus brasiliensis CBS 101740]|uniref:Uncharacterized protein n=1 Tax=Aspergillus brasiliensis (strain CBS 101740 / IMI 381727 / IBT 21946) TaxID=767769 RepID=A0A1L9UA14_ASPBC|nr:hypothetical protein ASPBRDRAFT_33109 [Aspergillus brasiliensis CBS 101740]
MGCNQPVNNVLGIVSDYLARYAESPQIFESVPDSIRSLSDAMHKVESSPLYDPRRNPTGFAEKLMHAIDWRECKSPYIYYHGYLELFMDMKRRAIPYPEILFRAHMHGELVPRFIDEFTEDYCDTFGSDLHLFEEWNSECEIGVTIYDPEQSLGTIRDLSKEISQHLRKTQINKGRTPTDSNYFFSSFMSLSGNFRWTLHKSFQKHRVATDSQQSGLAIFDISRLHEIGVRVWRVSDLLLFLDSKPRFCGTIIDNTSRSWARNADEYLCPDFIPKEALVNFVPCKQLIGDIQAPLEMFLRTSFRESKSLAVFNSFGQRLLSVDEYLRRVSHFLEDLLDHVYPQIDSGFFVGYLIDQLADYSQWGYCLTADSQKLRQMLRRLVHRKYAFGLQSWQWDQHYNSDWRDTCKNLAKLHIEISEGTEVEEYQS